MNRYVESILKRHPDRYVEEIKKDIRSHDFGKRIGEEFGAAEQEEWNIFESTTSEEELDEILDQLEIEKDF